MFTDNKDFYPTPQNLIDKMLDGLDWKMIHNHSIKRLERLGIFMGWI